MPNEDKAVSAVVTANEGPLEPNAMALNQTTANAEIKTTARACQNCGHDLDGPFCGMCGQPERSVIRFFGSVIYHFLDDIIGWDTRASRTFVPLMFRPGFLTNEYLGGRRVHYVPPLRLYFIVSILFFLVLQFSTDDSVKELVQVQQGNSEQINKVIGELDALKGKMSQPDYVSNSSDAERLEQLIEKKQNAIAGLKKSITDLEDKIEEIKQRQAKPDYDDDPADAIQLAAFAATVNGLRNSLDSVTKDVEQSADKQSSKFVGVEISDNKKADVSVDFGDGFWFLSDEQNKRLIAFGDQMEIKAKEAFRKDAGPLIKQVLGVLPHTMFVLLPIFAFLLKILYFFSKRYYMEHLMVALHSHAFIFINLIIIAILATVQEWLIGSYRDVAEIVEYLLVGFVIWIPIYLFIMQKRVYKQGVFFTLVKFGLVGFSYIMLLGITIAVAFFWGLANL